MIIDFKLFCKDYNEKILKNYNKFECSCPKCGANGRFHRHGSYFRYVTYLSSDGYIGFEPIEILRLKCISCNSTHAILPYEIIPFQIYTLPIVLFLCKEILINKKSLRNTVKKTSCTVQTIYQKLKLLKQNLSLIEFFLRQSSIYTLAHSISIVLALEFLILLGMKFFSYFHCHGQPIFINRRNTISYHYYFAAIYS